MTIELNNNNFERSFKRNRNESIISVSSASSYHSDSSEDAESLSRKSSTAQEFAQKDNQDQNVDFRRNRSMSDGAARRISGQEPFEVFPSLPDSVLEKMELLSHCARERLNEEDLEQKFVGLSLAFTIDAATIQDRCERQRRYRDQTETNLNTEIEKLIQKANKIKPLCIDAETSELLSALLTQIDIVMKAACHVTICSERYGAVQHELRISEAVNVMIAHVNLLKQQRDSARRQLQYTKRVLQNTDGTGASPRKASSPTAPSPKNILTKRRASIATITQDASPTEVKKIIRRTSDLSLRASSLTRNTRPNRLELGVDLVKIKEGMTENELVIHETSCQEEEVHQSEESPIVEDYCPSPDIILTPTTLRYRLKHRLNKIRQNVSIRYEEWQENGTIHEICSFCALMCFSISVIILANILIEVEFTKRGLNTQSFGLFGPNAPVSRRLYQKGS